MRIALVQQRASDDVEANRNRGLEALKQAAGQGAQLVCYAELAFTPFYPQQPATGDVAKLAETVPGPTTEAFASLAAELGVAVVLNLFERDGDRTYDCSPVIDVDGRLLGKTRMVHVPDYACFHEKDYYGLGDLGVPVVDTAVGKIGVAICYDRHYPEVMRALALAGAEVVVVPQAGAVDEWPGGLFEAEMRVASFHNGFFTALCNRVGRRGRTGVRRRVLCVRPRREGDRLGARAKGTEEILLCDVDLSLVPRSHARRLFIPDRRPELYRTWFG